LGNAYASGLGVERDLVAALQWWFRAADQGVSQAREAIAQLRQGALTKGQQSSREALAVREAFAGLRKELWQEFPDLHGQGVEDSLGATLLRLGRAH